MVMICISIRQKRSLVFHLPGRDIHWNKVPQGPKVRQIQEELNVIAGAYPEIPKLAEDGIYGPETEAAVRKFQSIFGLPVTER